MNSPNDITDGSCPSSSGQSTPWPVYTDGGAVHIDWDNEAPVTPHGQLPFFAEYLHSAAQFSRWCASCPLTYTSNNAPAVKDVLGTLMLSTLCGHTRYSHIDAICGDRVSAEVLGINRIVSSDSARRAFTATDAQQCEDWQLKQLLQTYEPLLAEPYIVDVDVSVVPLYGHQEGAVKGYNPKKPGRPSHAYHIYFIANVRVVLDVELRPGNETAGCYSQPALWKLLDPLPNRLRPKLIRGDVGYGNESMMRACEERDASFLFKVSRSQPVKSLIARVEKERPEWTDAGGGWSGCESVLKLDSWSRERRAIILRRPVGKKSELDKPKALPECASTPSQGEFAFVELATKDAGDYEYVVLVTNLELPILSVAQLYRERADCENVIDELKNQWGWSGFTTKDLKRSQIMARLICQVYNWWNIYARLAIPDKHAEAITSRPLLWDAVGRLVRSSGQRLLRLSSVNARAEQIKQTMRKISAFLQSVFSTAPQLSAEQRWAAILNRAFRYFLGKRRLLPQAEGAQPLLGLC
jgi:hypothetical protein